MKYKPLKILDLFKARRGYKSIIQKHNQPSNYKINRDICTNISALADTISNEAKTNRQEQAKEDKFNRYIDIATLVFVMITALLVWKQNEISYDAMIDTRKAATEQQRLANENNIINREAYTRVQRAFLLVDELKVNPIKDENGYIKKWEYTPIIRNSGNTPATKVDYIILDPNMDHIARPDDVARNMDHITYNMISYKIKAPQDPHDVLVNPSPAMKSRIIINGIVGPQREIEGIGNYWGFHILPADLVSNKLLSGQFGEFIFGSIRYVDIFNQEHVTKFCFSLGGVVTENGVSRPDDPVRCLHWNCIDEQCEADEAAYDAKFKEESLKMSMNKNLR